MIMREGELLGMGRSVREDLSEEVIQQLSQRTSSSEVCKEHSGPFHSRSRKGQAELNPEAL